ncbi:UNVERIFIED_CONTAM: hypothetical protein HDU68_003044 [Siphonaria sp. JEL0065]|nr:hypothetical protein HDU68_003044 [Siphonaria sp. JEL0065]
MTWHQHESNPAQVAVVESNMKKEAEMELKYGHGSKEHLAAKEETYKSVKAKLMHENQPQVSSKARYDLAQNWKVDHEIEDETRGGLIPADARPLIGLDYDNDLFMNMYAYVIDAFEVDTVQKRVTVKQTGGAPCILHQSGRKVENRVLEELSGLFGLEWDEAAVSKSKVWQKEHPEIVKSWESFFWKE